MKKPPSLTAARVRKVLPKRPEDTHKGLNGHVLIVAGSRGMSGAAALCARGALRIGAGLVTAAIVDSERDMIGRQLPEAMTLGLPETWEGVMTENALPVLKGYAEKHKLNTLAVGPGLSIDAGVSRVVKGLIKDWDLPLVLDADGLNNVTLDALRNLEDLIITPHMGELARLLKLDVATVKRTPIQSAQHAARECRLVCVLKGHPTIITDGTQTVLNPTGNPAMATGGMGDILTGIISGLVAQGLALWDAACAGVYLHGLAADLIKTSDRGLLASDVADALPRALSKIGVK
jgi:NAD(P)H-hydrate epimerase